ncbi:MAG: tRNA (adenine-N1)-methyltransferase [Candidatus Bathyarchaeia archaeon]
MKEYPRRICLQAETIQEGQLILLYSEGRRWLLKAGLQSFHTHKGIVDLAQLVGKSFGHRVKSSLNHEFIALKPTLHDLVMNLKRPTQIIYPKDAGLILLKLDVTPGRRILEVGTGSGALTVVLASMVKPSGHVYTYERRREFAEAASRNLSQAGLSEYVTVKNYDASRGVEERMVDAVIIDIGDPWTVLKPVTEALKPGHPLASFSPTVNQVEKTAVALSDLGYVDLETVECLVRNISVKPGKTRPQTLMIAHTGYITFARKTLP